MGWINCGNAADDDAVLTQQELNMLILRRVSHVVTFDDEGRELREADIAINGSVIEAVGHGLSPGPDDRVIEGSGLIALPGLINAHQHLYQGALRAIPEIERASIGDWLAEVSARCLRWWSTGVLTPETVRKVARAVLLESLLGGVTTVADQHYFHPAGPTQPFVEATIAAANEVGVRLHACRGTLTSGRAYGSSADDAMVQTIGEVLRHSQNLIETYHDPSPHARIRIALAPCGIHADRPELFREFAKLAAAYEGVRLHTHLYQKVDTLFCREQYGCTPWEFLEQHDWANGRVWLAHVVDPPASEIPRIASAGVSVAHLVAPDLRLGWGLAPLRQFLNAGVTVGFGTTGSASNDGANLLGDLRLALLAHRPAIAEPEQWPTARELLRAATRGSAACLGRPDLGAIAPGFAADISCWDLTRVDRAGVHDPVAGLLLTGLSDQAELVIVGGDVLVEHGQSVRLDQFEVARAVAEALRADG